MHIQTYEGRRAALLPLFRHADESESQIVSYYELGKVLNLMARWRTRRDSNPWPLPSEGSALSS